MDGATLVYAAWESGLTPPPTLGIAAWSDAHRILPRAAAAEHGQWSTARTPYLAEIMAKLDPSDPCQRIVFMKGAQIGAPLDVDTPVPTPDGWTTIGAIQPGETVFTELGRPARVLGVSDVLHDRRCLKFTFSDGAEVVCDEWHLWTVHDDFPGHRGKRAGLHRRLWTRRACEIADTFRHGTRHRYAIPVARPLQLADEALPADPYTLGVWLGDGHHKVNTFTIHQDDAPMVAAKITEGGHTTRVSAAPNSGKAVLVTIDPRGTFADRPSFLDSVRTLGLHGNKRVPTIYLRGSEAQRWALLQGLMDTDGHAERDGRRCEFTTVSRRLTDDAVELMRTLGLKPSIYAGAPGTKGSLPIWRVSFTAYADQPVFGLQRKQTRLLKRGPKQSETTRRRIVGIQPVPSRPVRCIEVENHTSLFLAGEGMVPTHNTEVGNNWIAHTIAVAPAPLLMVLPTVQVAVRVSKQRIAPMIAATPALRARVRDARARDSGNTLMVKEFDGGLLILTGANSAAGLRSMPVRYVFMDEVDEYPGDIDDQGDPVALAEERAATWADRAKFFLVSTPRNKAASRIYREWLASDQRRYMLRCPACDREDFLTWEGRDQVGSTEGAHWRIAWDEGQPATARAVCAHCGHEIHERDKPALLAAGRWVPTAVGRHVGYHLPALYSPWKTWAACAMQWVTAQHDPMALKAFVQTVLGEPWEERGEVEPEDLTARLETYSAEVPEGVGVLVASVDVQGDRLEAIVKGYGIGEESWLIAFKQALGDPAEDAVWYQVDAFLRREYIHANGHKMRVLCTTVDSGGHHTAAVYRFCKARLRRRVFAVKGNDGIGLPLVPQRARIVGSMRARLYSLCVDPGKESLVGRLRIPTPGPGYMHLPAWVDGEYLAQLTAEKPVWKWRPRKGTIRTWQKIRDRNEAFDLEVYALAALYILWPPGPALVAALAQRVAALAIPAPTGTDEKPAARPVRRKRPWIDSWR